MTETNVRTQSPAIDEILGVHHPVLDDGFIRVVDYMGNDSSIVQAARISYGEGTKKTSDDEHLIRYLMRHRHTTPLEMCEIKLHWRVPMDTWRQVIRHRTANVNEYSTRYSEAIDATQKTNPEEWRFQSTSNKQGSDSFIKEWPVSTPESFDGFRDLTPGHALSTRESVIQGMARTIYEERLSLGVAREQARKDLPLSTYTEAYWKIDLHNLLHFLSLRMDAHAQLEVREYANVIGDIVKQWVPLTWAAFVDYRLKALTLSLRDITIIGHVMAGNKNEALAVAVDFGWTEKSRERSEFLDKIDRLGIKSPWR